MNKHILLYYLYYIRTAAIYISTADVTAISAVKKATPQIRYRLYTLYIAFYLSFLWRSMTICRYGSSSKPMRSYSLMAPLL